MTQTIWSKSSQPGSSSQPEGQGKQERVALELIARFSQEDLTSAAVQEHLSAELCSLFHAQGAAVLTLQDQSANLTGYLAEQGKGFRFQGVNLDWKNGWVEQAMRHKSRACLNAIESQTDYHLLEPLASLGMPYWLCAPFVIEGQCIGSLIALRDTSAYQPDEQDLMGWIASALAPKIPYQTIVYNLQTSRDQLMHSRNVLRALFDSFPDSLYIVDQEYFLTAVNMTRARRAQQHPNQLVGRRCYQALFGRNDPCPECRVRTTLESGDNTTRTRRDRQDSGEILEWEIYSYPIRDSQNQVVQAILLEQDITDKLHLELTLAQSEKLAAMGQWAASLAHEINNPLTAIIANAQLLKKEIPPEDDRHELVELIALAGERANQVVRNMLDLARKDEYLFGPTDINQTIRKALDFLQHELAAREINLIYEPAESLPLITASPDHLQGVWLNLLTNAMDSTEDLPGEIRIITAQQGNDVHVIIADNGRGIPPQRLERIFEPFFTTKAPGRGTGLGLAVCARIIKQHGGRIQVESQPGLGTRFTVILPVT